MSGKSKAREIKVEAKRNKEELRLLVYRALFRVYQTLVLLEVSSQLLRRVAGLLSTDLLGLEGRQMLQRVLQGSRTEVLYDKGMVAKCFLAPTFFMSLPRMCCKGWCQTTISSQQHSYRACTCALHQFITIHALSFKGKNTTWHSKVSHLSCYG